MIMLFSTSAAKVPVLVRLLMVAAIALLVAGCNATEKAEPPKVAVAEPVQVSVAEPVQVSGAESVKVSAAEPVKITTLLTNQASFALGKVVSSIRRGTAIARFPKSGFGLCNRSHPRNSTLEWASGRKIFGNWRSEVGGVFYDALRGRGVNVVGNPDDLFRQDDAARSAEYLLGARIRKLTGTFCEAHRWLGGVPTDRYKGEFHIEVEWSVFSTLTDRTVARFETQGYFKQKKAILEGINVAFLGAFGVAVENILANRKFVGLLEKMPATEVATGTGLNAPARETANRIAVPKSRESNQPIQRIRNRVVESVVTIRIGRGHGSGFMVDRSGLLLTNAHVVKDAKRVQVIFANGLEVTGEVLRRSRIQDVALVNIPSRVRSFLPLRDGPAQQLEDVYAIGSPHFEALQSTITKGVVSAWRTDPLTGIRHIQADVPISGGNSGGPLVDRFGNVVGITVATLADQRAQNINFFIPIEDALRALNIELVQP